MEVWAATTVGTVLVDLETGDAELVEAAPPTPRAVSVSLPLVVTSDQVGARIAAVVDRRPPLLLSDDAGQTWREAGGGLPAGTAIAIDEDDPDRIVFASESRIYVSEDGGRFWRGVELELIGVTAVAFVP